MVSSKDKDFQPITFVNILSGQFHHQRALPEKFVNDVQVELAEVVVLEGPSGVAWEVGLKADNNALFFKHGWQKFVEDNYLEENDCLIFHYLGNSRFAVVMLDGKSHCPKVASFFVRKCKDDGLAIFKEKRHATESFNVMDHFPRKADKCNQLNVAGRANDGGQGTSNVSRNHHDKSASK